MEWLLKLDVPHLPRPVPPHSVAVTTFSGLCTDEAVSQHVVKLYSALERDKVKYAGRNQWQLARYNAPYVIPMFRTNEIHVVVPLEEVGEEGKSS